MSFERLKNVLRRDPDPVAGTGDKAKLGARFEVAFGEELFMAMFVNNDGGQGHTSGSQSGSQSSVSKT